LRAIKAQNYDVGLGDDFFSYQLRRNRDCGKYSGYLSLLESRAESAGGEFFFQRRGNITEAISDLALNPCVDLYKIRIL
jgi:hypothetical protein